MVKILMCYNTWRKPSRDKMEKIFTRKDQKNIHYMKIKLQFFSQLGGENIKVYKKWKFFLGWVVRGWKAFIRQVSSHFLSSLDVRWFQH